MSVHQAIYKLYPNVVSINMGKAYDADGNEVQYDEDAVKTHASNSSYIKNRQAEYPSLIDFADAYYWAQRGNSQLMDAYIAKCDAVKAKYPKTGS
jgi:hypothetical protein